MTPRWDGGRVAVSCTQGLGPLSGLVQEASAFTNSCTGLVGKISLENVFFCCKTFDTQSVNSRAMNRTLSAPSFLRYLPAPDTSFPTFQCFTSLAATCTFFYNEKKLFKHTRFRFFQSTTEATVSLILCKKKRQTKICLIFLGPFKDL